MLVQHDTSVVFVAHLVALPCCRYVPKNVDEISIQKQEPEKREQTVTDDVLVEVMAEHIPPPPPPERTFFAMSSE